MAQKKATDLVDHDAEITANIRAIDDWRGDTLARVRQLIKDAEPDIDEQIKWRKPSNPAGVPTYTHGGIVCTLEHYKDKVKVTFAQGASLPDPKKVFNASLEGKTRRAIDIREGDTLDEKAFQELIRSAVKLNTA